MVDQTTASCSQRLLLGVTRQSVSAMLPLSTVKADMQQHGFLAGVIGLDSFTGLSA